MKRSDAGMIFLTESLDPPSRGQLEAASFPSKEDAKRPG